MSLTSLSFNQKADYSQSYVQRRQVTLLSKSKESPALSNAADSQTLQEDTLARINSLFETPELREQANRQYTHEESYNRPLPPKVKMIKIILEGYLGRSLAELSGELNLSSSNEIEKNLETSANEQSSTSLSELQVETLKIDGQIFAPEDKVQVERWQIHHQELNFEMQASFELEGKQLAVNFAFSLASEHTSYSSVEMSARALKDPLIVQFGEQSLGHITDNVLFDINQDEKLDELPIFSGDVGYLVFDKNNNQQADSGNELFGPQTGNGFYELAKLDSDENGLIDANDDVFSQLYVWQPQQGVLISLQDANIKAIHFSAIDTPFSFYDDEGEIVAQLRQSSFLISETGQARGVHQVDVRI